MTDTATPPATCRNCGTPLLGPHCYSCGQPVSGLVRPLGNLFGDVLDNVFNIDTRIVRTLGPLFAKPGVLTSEYFAGRQVRYVTPVRLFFFLCIFAFFVGSFTMSGDDVVTINGDDNPIAAATTEAGVITQRDAQLAKLAITRKAIPDGPGKTGAEAGILASERAMSRTAEARIKQLREAAAKNAPVPPPMDEQLSFGNEPWDPKSNPVHILGAPAFADTWFNAKIARAKGNVQRMKTDHASFKDAFLGAIPTALFVLVPIFALLLKVLYVFKRRLYMEHLVVALHSHAFMSLELLLIFAMLGVQHLVPADSFLHDLASWVVGLLIAWIPLYLLLMQKRIYAQGWTMTLVKFFVLGTVYSILLGFAITGAAIASLVWM